jgi:hypothetical protein
VSGGYYSLKWDRVCSAELVLLTHRREAISTCIQFHIPLTATIAAFLASIGLKVQTANNLEHTFLPGITVINGTLFIDEKRLIHPGDILHEAGHLAVVPAAIRMKLCQDFGPDPGQEMMAIAWSYAAAVHLGLDQAVVFHQDGYRGESEGIIRNFAAGRYFGVPGLQWLNLTVDDKTAKALDIRPYPCMIKWLCD